jgi:hypothetical protein
VKHHLGLEIILLPETNRALVHNFVFVVVHHFVFVVVTAAALTIIAATALAITAVVIF